MISAGGSACNLIKKAKYTPTINTQTFSDVEK